MRQLLEQSTKIESNPTLFIELSNFVIRPVTLIRNFQNLETVSNYSELIFLSLCRSILSREFTETIKHIFIENMIKVQFPYKEFYYFLINYQSKIDLSVYLFYSVLKLVPSKYLILYIFKIYKTIRFSRPSRVSISTVDLKDKISKA